MIVTCSDVHVSSLNADSYSLPADKLNLIHYCEEAKIIQISLDN